MLASWSNREDRKVAHHSSYQSGSRRVQALSEQTRTNTHTRTHTSSKCAKIKPERQTENGQFYTERCTCTSKCTRAQSHKNKYALTHTHTHTHTHSLTHSAQRGTASFSSSVKHLTRSLHCCCFSPFTKLCLLECCLAWLIMCMCVCVCVCACVSASVCVFVCNSVH